jgi:hypothetical protein
MLGILGGANMQHEKNRMLAEIEARSLREAEYLAGEFLRAAVEEKEAILAGLEYEKSLAASCRTARTPTRS